ncbi:MAG: 3-oxoacyl-ACP synthase, partial [Lysobacterales bacterium CG_4_10_14_3_um_filter_64_11]
MSLRFTIKDWSAFASGLTSRDHWLAWAQAPRLPVGNDASAITQMPVLLRRRLERLGRIALQPVYDCQSPADHGVPHVFASRHGDLSRSYGLLQALARREPLSPTAFALSTHNAIAAVYAIARQLPANHVAVSAGPASAEAAVVEALGLLSQGASEVVVAMYDGPLPDDYRVFADEPQCHYSWAWRIALAESGRDVFSLIARSGIRQLNTSPGLPHGLDVLRFV